MAHATVEWFGTETIRKIAAAKGRGPLVQAISGLLRMQVTWDRGHERLTVMQNPDETARAFWERALLEAKVPDACPHCHGTGTAPAERST